jgi:uncharacterized repeat protein (TIGR03803 family)
MTISFARNVLTALVCLSCFVQTARASFIYNVVQLGPNVVTNGSGTIDTASLSFVGGNETDGSFAIPSEAWLVGGPIGYVADGVYRGISGPSAFGTGGTVAPPNSATSGGGDLFGTSGGTTLFLPPGYQSEAPLSNTDTYNNTTISLLGFTPGTYVYTWGSGPTADSLTINIGTVPEPASLAMLGVPAAIALLRRRRGGMAILQPKRKTSYDPVFVSGQCLMALCGLFVTASSCFSAPPTLINLATVPHPILQNLVVDPSGNIYGTANGQIFELPGPSHQNVSTVADLGGEGLIDDSAGNLYGTMATGGSSNQGYVFELSGPNHQTHTTLISFSSSDAYGYGPTLPLVIDPAGNLYGVTESGQASYFKLSAPNFQTISHDVGGSTGLGVDQNGNLFSASGPGTYNDGAIVEVSNYNALPSVVHSFNGSTEGYGCYYGLTLDSSGNIYGTLEFGGPGGGGGVFELSGQNHQTFTLLAAFSSTTPYDPQGDLILDADGNLWGTTRGGGLYGYGTIYELSGPIHQTLTTVFSYNGATDLSHPYGGLSADASGNLYSVAQGLDLTTGDQIGDIFELTNTGFAVVPEPASLAMLGVPAAIALLRRRRV